MGNNETSYGQCNDCNRCSICCTKKPSCPGTGLLGESDTESDAENGKEKTSGGGNAKKNEYGGPEVKCPRNHVLKRVSAGSTCDRCKRDVISSDKKSYHCSKCSIYICLRCHSQQLKKLSSGFECVLSEPLCAL